MGIDPVDTAERFDTGAEASGLGCGMSEGAGFRPVVAVTGQYIGEVVARSDFLDQRIGWIEPCRDPFSAFGGGGLACLGGNPVFLGLACLGGIGQPLPDRGAGNDDRLMQMLRAVRTRGR